MKLRISNKVFIDTIILICILFFSLLFGNSQWVIESGATIITAISYSLIFLSLWQVKQTGTPLISFTGIFTVLMHVFCLGNFYIRAFGQEEFYLFGDWFNADVDIKINAGLYSICAIEAIFIGMLVYIDHEKSSTKKDYKAFERYDDDWKKRIIYYTGVILFLITLPCRLYIDYSNILTSSVNGEYAGFTGIVGIIDDIQTLFIPSLICILYGKRDNQRFCRAVLYIYLALCIVVMAASGSRRYYVTAIIALFIFYINTRPEKKKKRNPFLTIVLIFAAIMILNLMTMIRNYRHTALGVYYLLNNHATELFSLDFLWESFTEFGLTGNVVYYAHKYFPSTVSYQWGFTYLASFIYILPIGWLVKLKASIGTILYGLSGSAVGGCIIADLYANWGWFSILLALVLGYIISKICYTGNKASQVSVKGVTSYAAGYVMLNYVRASTSEIMRYTAYIIIAIYIISKLITSRQNKYA